MINTEKILNALLTLLVWALLAVCALTIG